MITTFQERFDNLPEALQQEVLQFIEYLLFKYRQQGKPLAKEDQPQPQKPKLTFSWAGGLSELKEEFSSVELQHKINEYR